MSDHQNKCCRLLVYTKLLLENKFVFMQPSLVYSAYLPFEAKGGGREPLTFRGRKLIPVG